VVKACKAPPLEIKEVVAAMALIDDEKRASE
jgi:hypothetical protein